MINIKNYKIYVKNVKSIEELRNYFNEQKINYFEQEEGIFFYFFEDIFVEFVKKIYDLYRRGIIDENEFESIVRGDVDILSFVEEQ